MRYAWNEGTNDVAPYSVRKCCFCLECHRQYFTIVVVISTLVPNYFIVRLIYCWFNIRASSLSIDDVLKHCLSCEYSRMY